jgi:HEPN domain-containing protein
MHKAKNDLLVADTLLHTETLYQDSIAFHIQQSMEKYLKAFLISNNINIEKTHDLLILIKRCENIDSDFSEFIVPLVNKINDFAVQVRYDEVSDLNLDLLYASYHQAARLQNLILTKLPFESNFLH